MSTPETKPVEQTINIVLLDYDAKESSDFEQRLKDVLADLNESGFKKMPSVLNVHIGVENPPEHFVKHLESQIIQFSDDALKIEIEYINLKPQKRLKIELSNTENFDRFKNIILSLVEEQSSRISAIGFNFKNIYQPRTSKVTESSKKILTQSVCNGKNIEKTNVSFVYNENDYTKNFTLSQESESFSISANYHYEKFKTVRSVGTIRTAIKEQVNDNLKKYFDEFSELSAGLIQHE